MNNTDAQSLQKTVEALQSLKKAALVIMALTLGYCGGELFGLLESKEASWWPWFQWFRQTLFIVGMPVLAVAWMILRGRKARLNKSVQG